MITNKVMFPSSVRLQTEPLGAFAQAQAHAAVAFGCGIIPEWLFWGVDWKQRTNGTRLNQPSRAG
jgi:hypothetical protein